MARVLVPIGRNHQPTRAEALKRPLSVQALPTLEDGLFPQLHLKIYKSKGIHVRFGRGHIYGHQHPVLAITNYYSQFTSAWLSSLYYGQGLAAMEAEINVIAGVVAFERLLPSDILRDVGSKSMRPFDVTGHPIQGYFPSMSFQQVGGSVQLSTVWTQLPHPLHHSFSFRSTIENIGNK